MKEIIIFIIMLRALVLHLMEEGERGQLHQLA